MSKELFKIKNMNINYIIVGIDFSEYSKIVVREARVLAKKMRIPIIYAHSYSDEHWPEHIKDEIFKSLPEQIRETYNLEPSADVRIGFGDAAQFILAIADSIRNPLIVIGHKGRSPLVRLLLGSTAEKMAQISPYPVWIHRGDRIILPDKVLVPSDLGRQTNHTLRQLQSLSKNFHPDIELYHVTQEPIPLLDYSSWNYVYTEIMGHEDKQFAQFKRNHPGYKVYREQGLDVAYMINKRARDFDIVAVSPKGKGHSVPFIGHVTSRVIRSADRPVLIVH